MIVPGRFSFCPLLITLMLLAAGCNRVPDETTKKTGDSRQTEAVRVSLPRRMARARAYFSEARLAECEKELRAVLAADPDHVQANRSLSMLLNTEGRRWEAAAYTFKLLQLGGFAIQDLILLGSPEETYQDPPVIQAALRRSPNDPRPATGLVDVYRRSHRDQEMLDLLHRTVETFPLYAEAQAQLGLQLLDLGPDGEFPHWRMSVPTAVEAHPLIWILSGVWADQHNQPEAAARCYWEAIRRAPNNRTAHYNLALVLNQLNRTAESAQFLLRSRQLADLEQLVFPLFKEGPHATAIRKAADMTESMGRLWEAWGWHVALLSLEPNDPHATRESTRLRTILDRDHPPQVLLSADLSVAIDLSSLPLPRFSTSLHQADEEVAEEASVDFRDVATDADIPFRYFDSWVAADRELMLLETTGGGVAILDYDNDGWPDIYFTQCCKWPVNLSDLEHLDRLYRNLGNGQFQDVTDQCGIRDNEYTQGVAAGDVDNDGFADLYTANVGQNRLWHNNGDGTFSLVPHHHDRRVIWTTSAVIADVNGDTYPDIYDVNYVVGADVYTKHCLIDGHLRSCGPSLFDGEHDALFLNSGGGRWQDVSQQAGLDQLSGMGLGILAADLDHTRQPLQLYISNDETANFLLVNQSHTPGSVPRYVDEGTLTGTAFDGTGRCQASMGIACGDLNGDAQLDLVVGNYYNDYNTVYIQHMGRLFSDETRAFGLREPSFKLLTFGSQLIDGDLDGFPDLTIANGHVNNFQFRGEPWHMRPQYFRNVAGKRFVELQAERAGDYYERTYLGRGVAVVDWNRDGHEEFAVSNIAAPASLTVNRTKNTGHWVAVRVHGVQSARDAITTVVTLELGGHSYSRQLVGGSGFEASNQKQLVFGVGSAKIVDTLTIEWPRGTVQKFTHVLVDREYVAIEGNAHLHLAPRDAN